MHTLEAEVCSKGRMQFLAMAQLGPSLFLARF